MERGGEKKRTEQQLPHVEHLSCMHIYALERHFTCLLFSLFRNPTGKSYFSLVTISDNSDKLIRMFKGAVRVSDLEVLLLDETALSSLDT